MRETVHGPGPGLRRPRGAQYHPRGRGVDTS